MTMGLTARINRWLYTIPWDVSTNECFVELSREMVISKTANYVMIRLGEEVISWSFVTRRIYFYNTERITWDRNDVDRITHRNRHYGGITEKIDRVANRREYIGNLGAIL